MTGSDVAAVIIPAAGLTWAIGAAIVVALVRLSAAYGRMSRQVEELARTVAGNDDARWREHVQIRQEQDADREALSTRIYRLEDILLRPGA